MARRESIVVERDERRIVLGIVALALALRAGFALTLPAFQAPDERAHFAYVRSLAEEGVLPVQPDLSPAEALAGWPQSYQPPLAYLGFAPVAAASRALGAGPGVQLRVLRLQNAVYGALLVALVYAIACRLRPEGDALRLLAPLFVACLPGLASNAGSLNNDVLGQLAATALFWVWLAAEPGPRRGARIGAVFGAACLAKLTAATLAPLLLVVPWLQQRSLRAALGEATVAGAVAVLLLSPWLARNLVVYGDPLAIGVGSFAFERLAGSLDPQTLAQARAPAPGKALLQLFGRFGIANNLSWWPVAGLWLPLFALAAAGWLRRGPDDERRGPDDDRLAPWLPALGLAVLLAAAGLVGFSLRYYGAWQGRYLYVCIAPIALLLCEGGARGLAGPRRRRLLLVAALALLLVALDAALLARLDSFYREVPRAGWMQRTRL